VSGFRPPPARQWRSYGTEPLPTAAEALDEPFSAFPSWFLRIVLIETETEGTPFVAVSYHAPPGVSFKIVKPQQAVAFAAWLSTQNVPLLFGGDANTPKIDALDFANTRTHWHTGRRILNGEFRDDRLFGPDKVHGLDDGLRCWLALNPDEMDRLRADKPCGPLAITHRTGKRKNSPGKDRRFDSVWVSRHWVVRNIDHPYEKGIKAGSDHAPVVVDLDLMAQPANSRAQDASESARIAAAALMHASETGSR
jgi:hypothetical protein